MKKLLLFATLTLVSVSSMANEYCSTLSQLAKAVMFVRQEGVPMEYVEKDVNFGEHKYLLEWAYDREVENSRTGKNLAVKSFSMDIYLYCIKGDL